MKELDTLINLAKKNPRLARFADPKRADGCCGLATEYFLEMVEKLFPKLKIEEVHFTDRCKVFQKLPGLTSMAYDRVRHPWYQKGCRWDGHAVPCVAGWCVDWTARQFDPDAPFPLVFRLP